MPQDEENGIHIKKDFLLGRGELEVAASGRLFLWAPCEWRNARAGEDKRWIL